MSRRKRQATIYTPSEWVIEAFGGIRPLARSLGVYPNAVMEWKKSGRIPSRYHVEIIELAGVEGAEVTAEDVVHGRTVYER